MSNLNGIRVALLEGRMTSELAKLVQRYGGQPYCVPAVREQAVESDEQVIAFIDNLTRNEFEVVIFLTGVGVKTLFREAEKLGRLDEILTGLKNVMTVCRGPKPSSVLRSYGLQVSLNAREPFTTNELLEAIAELQLKDKRIALIHYGDRSTALAEALLARGATLIELCLYLWMLPEDLQPLQNLVVEIINGKVDAIAFTSQIQAIHLFRIAGDLKLEEDLRLALNTRSIVVSIGPTCTAALQQLGVEPQVIPEHPKMGHMISALAQFIDNVKSEDDFS
jgi:uroporphyrinogen-III synthase